jgi:hypothetical protein
VSLWPPPIHHRRNGRGVEHWHATSDDVGDNQRVGPSKKGHVTVVEDHHRGPIMSPHMEGPKSL